MWDYCEFLLLVFSMAWTHSNCLLRLNAELWQRYRWCKFAPKAFDANLNLHIYQCMFWCVYLFFNDCLWFRSPCLCCSTVCVCVIALGDSCPNTLHAWVNTSPQHSQIDTLSDAKGTHIDAYARIINKEEEYKELSDSSRKANILMETQTDL